MSTPEAVMYDWNTIDWRTLERSVFKLQKRIYQAASRNGTTQVHQLQRLLIKSKAAAILAVKRVTQVNRGKRTAGIDGVASLTDQQKLDLVHEIMGDPLPPEARPVRRVWIPKPGKDEKRPLGIPVMADRARQALAKMALEPQWEAKFEPNSYGFRPGRSCHDAVQAIFTAIQQAQKYVLDADIAKCFDRIDHQALLDKLDTFPTMRRAIKAWLKAGIMDGGKLFPVDEGTPQGGVISPLLANIALHGLETAVRDAFPHFCPPQAHQRRVRWKPQVIRYADDFVIIHPDLEALKRAKGIAEEWLKGMGLEMKPSKTRITHTLSGLDGPAGFDFLGFSIRQYERGKNRCPLNGMGDRLGFTPSIRPSMESQKRLLRKVREILHRRRTAPQEAIVSLLNPILRGWGNYFSAVVSKDIFHRMDHLIFWKLYAWACRRHPNKGRGWIIRRYWMPGAHGYSRFGVGKIRLLKMSDIPIERHVKVQGARSPFDGDAVYWSIRTGKHPELRLSISGLIQKQQGLCPRCGMYFVPGDRLVKEWASSASSGVTTGIWQLSHEFCAWLGNHIVSAVCDDNHHLFEEPNEWKHSRSVLKTSADGDVRA